MSAAGTPVEATGPGLRTRSLRRRVTVAVLAFVFVMLLVLGVTTDLVLGARLHSQLRQRLNDRATVAAALADKVTASNLVDRLEGDGVSVRLVTSDGQVLSKGPLQPTSTGPTVEPPRPGPAGGPAAPISQSGDLLQVTETLSTGSVITFTVSEADVRRTLNQVRTTLLIGGALVLLLAAVALGPVVGRALVPLEQMTATARSITAGDRGRRLRPDHPDTELGRTAEAFDAMLDEVEGAETQARFAEDRLRRFLGDAAHELRTPLTGVQAAAERLLLAETDRDQREQLSVTVIREARRAGRLVDAMLTMARIDQGLQLHRRPTDLSELLQRVAEVKQLSAPEARITVAGPVTTAEVDPDQITQVLGNLVDNALHAAGPQARIAMTVRPTSPVEIDVTDDGPGIPAADADRVFERLVRLDPARSGHPDGAGLGLSIAQGIARAHGGNLVLLPGPATTFRLTLP